MIQRLRSLLLIVASASFIANGAHAITGAAAASSTESGAAKAAGTIDPASIGYVQDGGLVSAVTFRMDTAGKRVKIRLSATDGWHSCSATGTSVSCAVSPRAVTDIHRLQIQTV